MMLSLDQPDQMNVSSSQLASLGYRAEVSWSSVLLLLPSPDAFR
jgi:hypothetical protein